MTKNTNARLNLTDEQLADVNTRFTSNEAFELSNAQLLTALGAREGAVYETDGNKKALVTALMNWQDKSAEAQTKRAVAGAEAAEGPNSETAKADAERLANAGKTGDEQDGKLPEADANAKLNTEAQINEAKQKEQTEANERNTAPYTNSNPRMGGAVAKQNREAAKSTSPVQEEVSWNERELAIVDRVKREIVEGLGITINQAVKSAVEAAGISDIKDRLSKVETRGDNLHERLKRGDTYKGSVADLGKTPGFEEEAPANGVPRREA